MKFADILETSEGLKQKSLKVAHDEQLDKALYVWFIQQRTSGTPISGPQTICKSLVSQLSFSQFNQFCSSLIFTFSIIWTLDYPNYFLWSQRVWIIEV